MNTNQLEEKALWLRRTVLEMAVRAKSGHVSTAFSQAELLVWLYYSGFLRVDPKAPRDPKRDRFILSKGQGGIGLYPILADLGFFPMSELDNFLGRGSILGVHAEWTVPGIEIVSGSLGHGLPIGVGIATALREDDKNLGVPFEERRLVVVMTGDAELYEGSNWEALIHAAHLQLNNLIVIVDRNGQGTIGKTDPVDGVERSADGPNLGDIGDKLAAFGFNVCTAPDGHDFSQIEEAFEQVRGDAYSNLGAWPLAIVAHTHKGRGASCMEDVRLWHYRVPGGADLESARRELGLTS